MLLPVCEWFVVFVAPFFFPKGGVHLTLHDSEISESDFKKVQENWAYAALVAHFLVLLGTLAWRSNFAVQVSGFRAPSPTFDGLLLGAIAGWAWYAALFLLVKLQQRLLPASLLHWEAPVLYIDGAARRSLFLVGAVAIEFWRATVLSALQADGMSPSNALVTCAAVYAGRMVLQGRHRIAYGALEGLVYGGLFLHFGTLAAPLGGRIIFDIGLYGLLRRTVRLLPSSGLPVVTLCPLCHKNLTASDFGQSATFRCPHCHEILGTTHARPKRILASYSLSCIAFLIVQEATGQLQSDSSLFLGLLVSIAAALGFTIWIDSLLPAKIDPGNPNLPTLDLTPRRPPPNGQDQPGPS